MQRFLTAVVAVPVALAALFFLPPWGWFALVAVIIEGAIFEYLKIVRHRAPHAPLACLLVLAPLAAWALSVALADGTQVQPLRLYLLAGALVISVGLGSLLLLSRTPLEETLPALGHPGLRHPLLRPARRQPPPAEVEGSLGGLPPVRHRLAGGHGGVLRGLAVRPPQAGAGDQPQEDHGRERPRASSSP